MESKQPFPSSINIVLHVFHGRAHVSGLWVNFGALMSWFVLHLEPEGVLRGC